MVAVEENRAYIKGKGHCVNVDNTAYHARLRKIKKDAEKADTITTLQSEVNDLKMLVQQLIKQAK